MADVSAPHPVPPGGDGPYVMRLRLTTVEQNDHVAGAAYLMKRADATALVVTHAQTREPVGIITEADISTWLWTGRTRTTCGLPADDCPPDRRQHHDEHR